MFRFRLFNAICGRRNLVGLLAFAFVSSSVLLAHDADITACSQCHAAQAAAADHNPIMQSLSGPLQAKPLRENALLQFVLGKYRYRIERQPTGSTYQVSDGEQQWKGDIIWAFGSGEFGQTYMVERDGQLMETRVSFFRKLSGLDLTIGAPPGEPKNLDEAVGRVMDNRDRDECFACHSTQSDLGKRFRMEQVVAGVQCQNCHGGATAHLAQLKIGKSGGIRSLNNLGAEDMNEFCGTCHRTWEKVQLMKVRGIQTLRFQPYRLTNSACFDATDERISCTACHNVHQPLVRQPEYYDAKCNACHSADLKRTNAKAYVGKSCPKESKNCVTCHMPKLEVPGSFAEFSDHHIRKPGGELPN
jgi:hypothetical protein